MKELGQKTKEEGAVREVWKSSMKMESLWARLLLPQS